MKGKTEGGAISIFRWQGGRETCYRVDVTTLILEGFSELSILFFLKEELILLQFNYLKHMKKNTSTILYYIYIVTLEKEFFFLFINKFFLKKKNMAWYLF